VDDTLAHAVEAYSGIPNVFFTWVRRGDKRIRFEFLDNTVELGERPRTVAYGDNATFNVFDVGNLLNIDRFARVNVNASTPASLFADRDLLAAEHNTTFLQRCVGEFQNVNFADQATGRIYLHVAAGVPLWKDPVGIETALRDADTRTGLLSVVSDAQMAQASETAGAQYLSAAGSDAQAPTLGQWATAMHGAGA
jgi:hypothetical protein